MRITEEKEVTRTNIEKIPVGIICDYCKEEIKPVRSFANSRVYNFFHICTSHQDWGNDSIDSVETFDACCPGCALKMAEAYIVKSYKSQNTRQITITHASWIEDASDYEYPHDIYGISEW